MAILGRATKIMAVEGGGTGTPLALWAGRDEGGCATRKAVWRFLKTPDALRLSRQGSLKTLNAD